MWSGRSQEALIRPLPAQTGLCSRLQRWESRGVLPIRAANAQRLQHVQDHDAQIRVIPVYDVFAEDMKQVIARETLQTIVVARQFLPIFL